MGDSCRVILVPSYRDAHHDHVFPQVAFWLLYYLLFVCWRLILPSILSICVSLQFCSQFKISFNQCYAVVAFGVCCSLCVCLAVTCEINMVSPIICVCSPLWMLMILRIQTTRYQICCGISLMSDSSCVAPFVLQYSRCYWGSGNHTSDLEGWIPMSAMLMHLQDISTIQSPRVFSSVI
jgi:hypothetical protein